VAGLVALFDSGEKASQRVGKYIFVTREWSIFVRVKCAEMLDFSVVKCDLFYSREA
jgi:hypothetical protein